MTADHIDDDDGRSTTRRSVLKAGLIASAVGIGGAATGTAQTDDASEDDDGSDGDTHTLTVSLIETRDASVVSGEVTVNGQTKTTRPIEENSVIIQTEFELEDGTYTVSGTFDRGEPWRTNEREITIDGEDKSISLLLYPPGSDELEENDGDTHTLTVALIESGDADVVSGEVTVNGQTKTTAPVDGDPAIIQTEFELEDGTYTVSGTFDRGEPWRTNKREVTIDGDDEYLSLLLYPPGSDELEENDGDTHALTVYLVESEDADIVSGEVTVDGQTKPTTSDDPHVWSADFELENGSYTVSGTSDAYADWRTNEREITIDGDDMAIELFLYPPGSDELEETDPEDGDSQDDADGSDTTDDDPSDETESEEDDGQSSSDDDSQNVAESSDDTDDTDDVPSDEMNSEENDGQSSPDVADDTSSVNHKQDTDDCP